MDDIETIRAEASKAIQTLFEEYGMTILSALQYIAETAQVPVDVVIASTPGADNASIKLTLGNRPN